MQEELEGNASYCLNGLAPGTTYYYCVAPRNCQNEWNCGTFTTFKEETLSIESPLYKMDIFVEGSGSNWVQLSWPPPNIRSPATSPIGYVINLNKPKDYLKAVVYISAPWVGFIKSTSLIVIVTALLTILIKWRMP